MDLKIALFENDISSFNIPYITVENASYFKGKDIANALGYADTVKAIAKNVDDDDKMKFEQLIQMQQVGQDCGSSLDYNDRNTIYINESGLYSLILRSDKPEAKLFKKWITSELLPTIRMTGSYVLPKTINNQIVLRNETDLHYKVIDFIRTKFPDMILLPGLGEHQNTTAIRNDCYNKGYIGGQPDIHIVSPHKSYSGFAIELKTPKGNGEFRPNQHAFLTRLKLQNHKVLVSDDYDEILMAVIEYARDMRIQCLRCAWRAKSLSSLAIHHRVIHRDKPHEEILYNTQK